MNGRILVGLFLCSLFLVVGGDAQSPDIPFSGYMRADGEKPIWALEFIKVQPENFAVAMQYLDDHWMRVRAEAKRHGAVLDYHLISNAGIVTPGHKAWDQDSIVLLTKDKNMDAFMDTPSGPDVESPESASECTSPLRVQSCVRQGRRTAAADGFTVLEEVAAKKQEAI